MSGPDRGRILSFAYFPPRFDDTLVGLAAIAETEEWTPDPSRPNAILKNYIKYTFLRLGKEGKIRRSEDGEWAAFNTGLLTSLGLEIFALFEKHNNPQMQPWFFKSWALESDRLFMAHIKRPLPPMANFVDPPNNLIYDMRCPLTLNIDHILDERNIGRLPENLRGNRGQATAALMYAKDLALKRLQRNYKLAVPHWHSTHGSMDVQLLLPLDLTYDGKADAALVVEVSGDGYRGSTVLTLDMAYSNARLVARPDSEWLRPNTDSQR
jgi:hypothetical protein